MDRSSDAPDRAELHRYLGWLAVAGLAFVALFAITGLATDPRLVGLSGVAGVFALGVLVARALARTRPADAALLTAGDILVTSVVGTWLVPFLYPAQVVSGLLAIAVALPWLHGRALAGAMGLAVVAVTAVVALGARAGEVPQGPVELFLLFANATASTAHVHALVWQFARQIRQGGARFRTLVEATSQIVFAAEPSGRIVEDSPTWRAFTGQTPEDLRAGRSWDAIHPDDRRRVRADWEQALATGEPFDGEYRIRRADGAWRWVHARGALVRERAGGPPTWVFALSDVTDRRRGEERLRIEARHKDELLATLGHELRNPLAAIAAAVGLLERRGAAHEVRVIGRQLAILQRLVADLLDVARVTHGRIPLHLEPVAVEDVVAASLELVEPERARKQQPIEVRVAPDLAVQGDRTRLVQVLTNLLANAIRFSPERRPIAVEAEARGEEVELRVIDRGQGMSRELLGEAFEPFVQGERAIDRSEGGLGLGLALVRRLVELHGGTVEAESAVPGRGSTFRVRLPRAELPAAPAPAPAPAPVAHPRRRVLVVEDNPDTRELLANLLRQEGHEVTVAADGEEAIARAGQDRPDVVLLDIGLPKIDGYEVARRLRPELDARIVAVTGYGQESDRRRALEAGCDEHVPKPVDPDVLLALVAG